MAREDLRAIVETPDFQRALRRYPKDSVEGRLLKGLERLALGTKRELERAKRAHTTASVKTLRQSADKESGDGDVEHLPV